MFDRINTGRTFFGVRLIYKQSWQTLNPIAPEFAGPRSSFNRIKKAVLKALSETVCSIFLSIQPVACCRKARCMTCSQTHTKNCANDIRIPFLSFFLPLLLELNFYTSKPVSLYLKIRG